MSSTRPPAGAFVAIIGPDGTGKTTLARELIAAHDGPTAYFHFRPSLRAPFAAAPPHAPAPPEGHKIKESRRFDRVLGWFRLSRTAGQCLLAYWLRIRPAVRAGTLVVSDRWLFGYVSQPEALRYYGPRWLARTIIVALPAPTLTVNLVAPVPVLLARKQELTAEEIVRELAISQELPVGNLATLSSEQPPAQLVAQVFERLPFDAVDPAPVDRRSEPPGRTHTPERIADRHDER